MLICALLGTILNTQGGMKQDLHWFANPKKELMWKNIHQIQKKKKKSPVWINHKVFNSCLLPKLVISATVAHQTWDVTFWDLTWKKGE